MRKVAKDDHDELESSSYSVTREEYHQLPGQVNQVNIPSSPLQASPQHYPGMRERGGELIGDLITPHKGISIEKQPETLQPDNRLRDGGEEGADITSASFSDDEEEKKEGLNYLMIQEPLGRVLL